MTEQKGDGDSVMKSTIVNDCQFLQSEIKEIEELIASAPEENVIERMSLEARLESVKADLTALPQMKGNSENPTRKHLNAKMKTLSIDKCPHGNLAVSLNDGHHGVRLTPDRRCCGEWEIVKEWKLNASQLSDIANEFEIAAEDEDE